MAHVTSIFSWKELQDSIEQGWTRIQSNENQTLFIYNYTEKAAYEKHWDAVTLNCRGLILDVDGQIVARPWKKFFNYGEGRLKIDDVMPVEVTDKMDGSLGILYKHDGWVSIATRGSFTSDQAKHAREILDKKYINVINEDALEDYTFLFEIIYPANRIVLNYSGLDDLVLLGGVHKERGYYLGPREAQGILGWPGPTTRVFEYSNLAEAFAAPMRENAEGFVCRSGTEMVKIKQVDYVELHKIVTNLSERTVWAALADGKTVEDLCVIVPDEWHEWLQETADELEGKFDQLHDAVLDEYIRIQGEMITASGGRFDSLTRKDWAQAIVKSPHRAYLFLLLDRKPIDGAIWHSLKPAICKE